MGSDGLIEVWRDGIKIHNITGRNMHYQYPKWKMGLYNASLTETENYSRVIYFDNIRVGKSESTLLEMMGFKSNGFTAAPASVDVDEQKGTNTFEVVLNKEPAGNVVIDVGCDKPESAAAAPSSLIFTPDSWSVPQVVTVTAAGTNIPADVTLNVNCTVNRTATADPDFLAMPGQSVTVTVKTTVTTP